MLLGKGGVLGIDIGSSSIKLVELEQNGSAYQLRSIGEALLPQDSIVKKAIVNSEVISHTLSILIDDLGIETDDAAISISGDPVLIKRVRLPKMSNAELKKSITWELEQSISQGIKEVNYDYQVIPGKNAQDNIDVLIVAVNKNVTNDYISIVTDVGLNPIVVDLDVFSLASMYEVNYPESESLLALVNIGASFTNINIIENGESLFARDLNIGGNRYTDLIMAEMELTYQEAEEVKHTQRVGLTDPGLEQLAHNFIDSICSEIKETLDFFSSTHSIEKVKRIMIGGGSSSMASMKDTLSEITHSYVGILNPFRKIVYNERTFDPEYIEDVSPKMNVAMGLALRTS
ncbi:MAG: type IV pilus assembly protein PilM [Candidatus Dadabacteria bacterium]|nr:type IV pilus assembly protein PilM [Candidatus Dadabacteria bacterium]